MATYIKPTLTVVSNANSAANDKGPLSIALALTAKPLNNRIEITTVKSGVLTPGTTPVALFTDLAQTEGDQAGTHGSFIYIKNTSAADHDVSFAFLASGTSPTAAEVYGNDNTTIQLNIDSGHRTVINRVNTKQ